MREKLAYNVAMRIINISKVVKFHKWKKPLKKTLFRLIALGVIAGVGFAAFLLATLPSSSDLSARVVDESTKIYDREGGLLYEVHGEVKRTKVGFGQITEETKQATVAIEDKDFYKHRGLSLRGIVRSVLANVLSFEKSQGGSTITQQLVKNALLDSEKRYSRKIKEWILAVQVETKFTKDEILELYLNEIPYGRNAYGIEAASQSYFGKHAKDLTLAESAYLAALPQAPSFYNPMGQNRKSLDSRKDRILQAMKDQGFISEDERNEAALAKVEFLPPKATMRAAHFVLYIQQYLTENYGETKARTGGLQVYTTLDPKLQEVAENVVREGGEKNLSRDAHNAGLVAIDPKTGQILAMVGSRDYFGKPEPEGCKPGDTCKFEPNYNVALAPRQPGSSFKPYAYMTAFGPDFKYAPASLLMDVETNFGDYGGKSYIPNNYNGREYGPISIRSALAGSLNIPAVKIVSLVGVERVTEMAREVGITSPMKDCGLSLVLGGCEVRLLDHTAGFATIANGGVYNKPTSILKILDRDGKEIESYKQDAKRVVNEQAAFLVTDIMRDADARRYIFGAGSGLVVSGRTTAGKTGTTQNWRDGWMMGFSPSLVAGVWVGNNDGTFMNKGADGSIVAAPIWKAFMTEALKKYPEEPFAVPKGVEKVEVDALSGLLPGPYTQNVKSDYFADYSVPKERDNVHVAITLDTRTGQVATDETPFEFRQTKQYTILHSERQDNESWESAVRKWAANNGYEYPPQGYVQTPIPAEEPDNGYKDGLQAIIYSPQDEAVFLSSEVPVSVAATGNVKKMEVLVDGELIKSITNPPFESTFTTKMSSGSHVVALRVSDASGNVTDNSVSITVADSESLVISRPVSFQGGNVLLSAQSQASYDAVTFYAVNTKTRRSRIVGVALPQSESDGSYMYSVNWEQASAGTYTIYAKAGDVKSDQIAFEVK